MQAVTSWETAEQRVFFFFTHCCGKCHKNMKQQDELSCSPENNDQTPDLSRPGEVTLAFSAVFFYEINSFMVIGV